MADITILPGGASHRWNPRRYRRRVRECMAQIFGTETGRAVRAELTRRLTIVPYTGNTLNALTLPLSARDSGPEGRMILHCGGPLVGFPMADSRGQPFRSTGRGSDVLIAFTPWRTPGPLPDADLLHEFVHAARMMAGLSRCEAQGDHFDTAEEVHAIAVTNLYRAERGIPGVRRDHHTTETTTAGAFNRTAWARVLQLCRQMPRLTGRLARVETRSGFNPFLDAI